ncbi:hypothetical protein EWI07_02895 [Sporolactobacillus sp. THM7-4]|nr:hypothetical protein EWI07_02895 [Sporolactobacillus sp. THM7-4]
MIVNKARATVTLALTAGLTYAAAAPSVTYAKPSLSKISNETAAQQSLLQKVNAQQKAIQNDLDQINKKQLELTGRISDGQAEINQTKDKISALQKEIKLIEKRIEKRKGLLKDRLVSIYKNGGSINYLDVLLGSKNFGDFIDRTKALYTITTQDQQIITDQKNDQEAVREKKNSVEKKQLENIAKMAALQKNLAAVEQLQAQKKVAASALNNKEHNINKQLSILSTAAAALKKEQSASFTNPSNIRSVSYEPSTGSADKNSSDHSIGSNQSNDENHSGASNHSGAENHSGVSNHSNTESHSGGSNHSSAPFTLSASVATGGIQGILNYGNRFIGHSSYVWGASDPSSGRFDCSGFVNAAFAANGIRLGGNTDSLVNKGSAVSYSNAKPGDLVFFNTYKTNGHVGIYLGGGRFIGSQSSSGVAVVSMSNPYWSSHFRGVVRRILN